MPEYIVFYRAQAEFNKICLGTCGNQAFWHILVWDTVKDAYEYLGSSYCDQHIDQFRPEHQNEIDLSEVADG